MTSQEAKQILELYRPGTADEIDQDVVAAKAVAEKDAALKLWLDQHVQAQAALRKKFRQISAPTDLKDKILANNKVVRPKFRWTAVASISAAAAIVLFACLWFLQGSIGFNGRIPSNFADYKSRMVRSALREYKMDIVTNDLAQVRHYMSAHGAPSDFTVPKGLAKLNVVGGGALKWRNHDVTMVCFKRPDDKMLFFFVMNRSAVQDPPAAAPELSTLNRLQAATWTDGDKTYLLAGPPEAQFVQKYVRS